MLSTSCSIEITTPKHFYSSSTGVIFNGRLTGLLATLSNDNRRSGALKAKSRTAQKQRSMAEGLQGLAFFFFYVKFIIFTGAM